MIESEVFRFKPTWHLTWLSYVRLPVSFELKIDKRQLLIFNGWGCLVDNGRKLAMGQPKSSQKNEQRKILVTNHVKKVVADMIWREKDLKKVINYYTDGNKSRFLMNTNLNIMRYMQKYEIHQYVINIQSKEEVNLKISCYLFYHLYNQLRQLLYWLLMYYWCHMTLVILILLVSANMGATQSSLLLYQFQKNKRTHRHHFSKIYIRDWNSKCIMF